MKKTRIIMKLTMINGKEFSFYVEDEEAFDQLRSDIRLGTRESETVMCIPTLFVKAEHVMTIEKFYEELKG